MSGDRHPLPHTPSRRAPFYVLENRRNFPLLSAPPFYMYGPSLQAINRELSGRAVHHTRLIRACNVRECSWD
jgi:hypothetical protein